MRASSLLLFQSQRPFTVCCIPYRVLLSAGLIFAVVIGVLLACLPLLVLIVCPLMALGLVPVFFACRKDHHADRLFYARHWWKRQERRGFAAGGPYLA